MPDYETRAPATGGVHGRRRGKALSAHQAVLTQTLLPRLAVPAEGAVVPDTLFQRHADCRLEIGFGGGELLAAAAQAHPEMNFIGCEPFLNGYAKLLATINQQELRNIRLFCSDAMELLTRLPDGSFTQIDVFYPDPWPKRRQRKRRFVSTQSIAQFARILRPDGIWRFASDIDDYVGWTLTRALSCPDFLWQAQSAADWQKPWADWRQQTRYEAKARQAGRKSCYLTFRRR